MIFLIQPSAGRWERLGTRMPLGLLYIATYLKKYKISSKIIDTRINKSWEKELFGELKEGDIVGITCMIGPQITNAIKIAQNIKAKKPGITIVFGGMHPSIVPELAIKESYVDIVVKGEGEKPLLELAKGLDLSKIKGIYYKIKEGSQYKIVKNPAQKLMKTDEIPIPDYSFLDMKKYSSVNYYGERSLCIQGSRGCPYACGFCYNEPFSSAVWRPLSIDKVLKNVDILVNEYGAKTLYFVDDNIAVDPNRFLELLKKIKEKPYKVNLAFQGIRIDAFEKFSDEIYILLRESGVKSFDIGIETLNNKILKNVDKFLTRDQILKTLEKLEKQDFIFKFNILAGLPGQTKEDIDSDIKEAIKISKKHKNSYVLYNIYVPFPNTKLYSEAVKSGFIPPPTFEAWGAFAGTSWMEKYSWFPKKIRKYLQDVNFLFMFSNKNILVKVSNKLVKNLVKAYYPIALFRMKYNFHFLMLEKKFSDLLD